MDPKNNPKLAEVFRLTEDRKNFLVSKILPFGDTAKTGKRGHSLSSHIDSTSATLIVKYLSLKRPFFNSFDIYLHQILSVLSETSIQVCICFFFFKISQIQLRKIDRNLINKIGKFFESTPCQSIKYI